MNIQTLIVLLIIIALLILAVRSVRKKGSPCGGCSSARNCPHSAKKKKNI